MLMNWMWQDIRFGFRTLQKDRASLVMAILALGLGIGSTTAMFSVIDNVLIEPFPYKGASRLTLIEIHDLSSKEPGGRQDFLQPEFLDYQEQNHVFEDSMGGNHAHAIWTGMGPPESLASGLVTGNTFEFLGMQPLRGRYFTPADAKPAAEPVFVMSYKLWQERFFGDPNILGKSFTFDGKPTALIGIMPPRFNLWGSDIWQPAQINRGETDPNAPEYILVGHLKAGQTLQSGAADVQALARRLAKLYPKHYPKRFDARLITLTDRVVGPFRQTLYLLLVAVGLLLLIACANVANLLLAKATAREKEFAIRSSLGAGRLRILRQLFVESLLLAFAGATFGCGIAWLGLKALVAALPREYFPSEAVIGLNGRVLLMTMSIAILTALLFGLAPALGSFTRNLSEPLKAGGRGNSGFRRGRLRNTLIIVEVTLSLLLLTGAGLLMRSFLLELQTDLGMNTQRLLTTQVWFNKGYKTSDSQARFARELTKRLENLPGVVSATAAADFPPLFGIDTDFEIAGQTNSETLHGRVGFCDSQFFHTVGVRLLHGRLLTDADVTSKRKVVVVNQTLASRFFPGGDSIGKQIKLVRLERASEAVPNPWFEIVGVASDLKNNGVREDVLPQAYGPVTFSSFGGFVVFIRTVGNPALLTKALDGEVLSMDKNLLPQHTDTMETVLDEIEYAKQRFGLQMFAAFAAIGLVLVSVGVYSVVSYTVSQQQREIGIRMALGATAGNVRWWVILSGMRFILAGIICGVAAAFVCLRLLKSQIYGVSAFDPMTLFGVVAILILVGLAACYVPSISATRVDPLVSLRYE
jgi:putative ABC transport system permease protein